VPDNKQKINFEKLGVYIGSFALLCTFWTSQDRDKEEISLSRERIAKLEIEVAHLKEKK
jgi:hypothetical protein